MALANYTDLQAAIASRLHSTSYTALIPDWITLAEKSLNRVLRLSAQELETTLTATIGSRSLTLPSLFGSPIALYLTTYLPRIELEYRLPEEMQVFSSDGPAKVWTIDGSVINTDTPADQAYTYTLRYVSEFDIATTATNSLLTNYPDLYLYGALIESGNDLVNINAIAMYEKRYGRALQECLNNEHANRSLAKLTTELSGHRKSNIISGV